MLEFIFSHFIETLYVSLAVYSRERGLPLYSREVKTDELDATYKDGILKLTLPKAEVSEVKKIEVKEEKTGKKAKTKKA